MAHHAIQVRRNLTGSSPQAAAVPAVESLPAAFKEMPGETEWFRWRDIRIHYKRLGSGPPLLLVHNVDVGASCIEWRRTLPDAAENFTVYAVDMPGFGQSDTSAGQLHASLYLGFLQDFTRFVSEEHHGSPLGAIGSGIGAAYLACIASTTSMASRLPVFDRLALVCPTGLSACHPHPLGGVGFQALSLPFLSIIVSAGTSRSAILDHLKQDVYGDELRASMDEVEARYWATNRPGAFRVERARVSSLLNVNLKPAIPILKTPTLLAWGKKAICPPASDGEEWRRLRPETRVQLFEQSGLCPHLEEPARFNDMALDFLGRAVAPDSQPPAEEKKVVPDDRVPTGKLTA